MSEFVTTKRGNFMKKIFTLLFFAVLLSVNISLYAAPQSVSVSSNNVVSNRSIIKGDTLWDISKQVYGDPYFWPSLWEVNKSTITNPHLIYVGQSIILPSKEDIKKIKPSAVPSFTSKISPEKKIKPSDVPAPIISKEKPVASSASSKPTTVSQPAQQENIEPQPQEKLSAKEEEEPATEVSPVVSPDEKSSSQNIPSKLPSSISPTSSPTATYPAKIVGANYTPDGIIVGMKEEKLLTSQGDVVYASIPFAKISAGDRLGIYRRTGRKIYNPSDGRYLGDELVRIGTAGVENVTTTDGTSAILRILMSREPIEKKDWLILEK